MDHAVADSVKEDNILAASAFGDSVMSRWLSPVARGIHKRGSKDFVPLNWIVRIF